MKRTATIAAAGDLLMWQTQIDAAREAGKGRWRFDGMFRSVAPLLRRADLTIGNLETTLSGGESRYERRNPRTGWPMFNCPDELAPALKRAGFNVLTTANNHCMDRGVRGLTRTLEVLDRHGLAHTGTFRSAESSRRPLIRNVNGIRMGIAAYTYGTNRIHVPQPWRVNRIQKQRMLGDIRRLRQAGADLVIVCIHFGREFHRHPSRSQRALVNLLLKHGADIILGAHPHVLQPVRTTWVRRADGTRRKAVVSYSLGNFTSDLMRRDFRTLTGVILQIGVAKDQRGTRITHVRTVPTWVVRTDKRGRPVFRVVPIRPYLSKTGSLPPGERKQMKRAYRQARKHLGR